MEMQKNNPLHGITLEQILLYLVENKGWNYLADEININCFKINPTIKSSLIFFAKNAMGKNQSGKLVFVCIAQEQTKINFNNIRFLFMQNLETTKAEFLISTNKNLLQIDVIHNFLQTTYWASNRNKEKNFKSH